MPAMLIIYFASQRHTASVQINRPKTNIHLQFTTNNFDLKTHPINIYLNSQIREIWN